MILFDLESSDFLINFVILQVDASAARASLKMQQHQNVVCVFYGNH
jgi:hypothetical protein